MVNSRLSEDSEPVSPSSGSKKSLMHTFPMYVERKYLWAHLQNECNVFVLALLVTVWKTYLTFGKNVGLKCILDFTC